MSTSHPVSSAISTSRVLEVGARIGWAVLWVFLTAFAWFEVVKHGYISGTWTDAIALTATAVGFFVLPDLTFAIGAGQPVEKGSLPQVAVPYYNALHRIAVPAILTSVIGIGLAPLNRAALIGFVGGLSWMAHVSLDRAAGYGLRRPNGSR